VATCFTDHQPFDPRFGAAGGEDLDLFLRIGRRGRRIVWCPESVVTETVPPSRTEFSNQVMRVYSSAQGYADASIKNSETPRLRALDIMARGALQSLVFAPIMAVLGALSYAGLSQVDRAFQRFTLKAAAGLGKVMWWRRLNYYHLEAPQV